MTRRSPSRSLDQLMALAAQDVEEPSGDFSASALNSMTADRMFGTVQRRAEHLRARFVGGLADQHQLPVRSASKAILSIQESVSSIGARLTGLASVRGRLPSSVLDETELRLSPQLLPGSVVFELTKSPSRENELFTDLSSSLLDDAFEKLFLLLVVTQESANPGEVPEAIRSLGPRAAKHIFDLCAVLVDDDLGLDFSWTNRTGQTFEAQLTRSSAAYLKQIAKDNSSVSRDEQVDGVLVTASVETSQKLRLQPATGAALAMTAPEELRRTLARYYNRKVRTLVRTTERANEVTGSIEITHVLLAIEEWQESLEADSFRLDG